VRREREDDFNVEAGEIESWSEKLEGERKRKGERGKKRERE